jgi:TM2 domain-containing membrane protein YozV
MRVYQVGNYRALHNMADTMSPRNGDVMTTQVNPPAGWYPNTQGQQQWWDGHRWGQVNVPKKSAGVAYVLLLLLGGFAAHRFYLRRYPSAIIMLLTWWAGWALTALLVGWFLLAAVVIWWIIDLFLIPELARTTPR